MIRFALVILSALLMQGCVVSGVASSLLSWSTPETIDANRLDQWLDDELAPYLVEELSGHPRFKGETVALVSMQDGKVQADSDEFTRRMRRQLNETLLDAPGVNLVRTQDGSEQTNCPGQQRLHYQIALQIDRLGNSEYVLSVRAYDLEDGTWVSGFGKTWRGRLSRSQREALAKRRGDKDAPGSRDDPFSESQADLLARHLATDLSCRLLGYVGEELVIYPQVAAEASPHQHRTLSLVGNYLSQSGAVSVTEDPDGANLILYANVYEIDGQLHQFWAAVKPAGQDHGLPMVNSHAYVRVGVKSFTQRRPLPPARVAPTLVASTASMLSSVNVVTPADPHLCGSLNPWRLGSRILTENDAVHAGECYALDVGVHRGAIVFLINHTLDADLVRLLPASCKQVNRYASVATENTLRFPSTESGSTAVFEGEGRAGFETFYIIAAADHHASYRVQRHLRALTNACEDRSDKGTAGPGFDDWFAGLSETMTALKGRVDWRAVQVQHAH